LPLDRRVSFIVQQQNQNRIQVPKIVRWQYKLEPSQVLTATVRVEHLGAAQDFLTKMRKDGRITIPRRVAVILRLNSPQLKKCFLNVTLVPA